MPRPTWYRCDPHAAFERRRQLEALESERKAIDAKIATLKAAIEILKGGDWEVVLEDE